MKLSNDLLSAMTAVAITAGTVVTTTSCDSPIFGDEEIIECGFEGSCSTIDPDPDYDCPACGLG